MSIVLLMYPRESQSKSESAAAVSHGGRVLIAFNVLSNPIANPAVGFLFCKTEAPPP
jgi:hypothetical protein